MINFQESPESGGFSLVPFSEISELPDLMILVDSVKSCHVALKDRCKASGQVQRSFGKPFQGQHKMSYIRIRLNEYFLVVIYLFRRLYLWLYCPIRCLKPFGRCKLTICFLLWSRPAGDLVHKGHLAFVKMVS